MHKIGIALVMLAQLTGSAFANGGYESLFNGEGVLNDAVHLERKVGMSGHIALQLHAKDETLIRFKALEIMPLAQPRDPGARRAR